MSGALRRRNACTTALLARRLAAGFVCLLPLGACSDATTGGDENPGGSPVIELDPGAARLDGKAQNKCWSDRCYWVVWCGHNICDGAWSWSFPADGSYEIVWKGVSYKCAGSPPYQLRINDEVVRSGRLAQYGSCGECVPGSMAEVFTDTSLGTYPLEQGDKITLYVRNDFACGIEGPGAYAAFKNVVGERRD